MVSYFRKHRVLSFSICISFAFWLAESFLHKHFFDKESYFELIPRDANELWMRSFIFILIIIIGYFSEREIGLQKKIAEEKNHTLQAIIHSVDEIAGNTLSLMSHYCDEFVKSEKFDKKSVLDMKEIINDTFSELKKLSNAKNLTIKEKHKGYYKVEVTQPDKD